MGKSQSKMRTTKVAYDQQHPVTSSLLDVMQDGREFESTLKYRPNINIPIEWKRAIKEIEDIRKNPLVCFLSNTINSEIKSSTSIDQTDTLPFSEMISTIPSSCKEIDIMLVTNGGSGQQVAKMVNILRPRFEKVTFIIPNVAMSAGTIFIMSGNDIIMGPDSYFGPIDPQIPNKDGRFVPAQSIITLINKINEDGQKELDNSRNPRWVDLQILNSIDVKDIGNALNASQYSIDLVSDYLTKYKFAAWTKHKDGRVVDDTERSNRANKIAKLLCEHSEWKSHSNGISRDVAHDKCELEIIHAESIPNFYRAMRRFWAFSYWVFQNTNIAKAYISQDYVVLRSDTGRK